MVPLIRRSVEGLVKLFEEKIKTGESFEFFRYLLKYEMAIIHINIHGIIICKVMPQPAFHVLRVLSYKLEMKSANS